jgi:glucokinase
MTTTEYAIGVDIGGTKINIGLIGKDGTIVADCNYPTEARKQGLIDRVINGIESLMAKLRGNSDLSQVKGVGLGSAGQIDFNKGTVHFATDLLPGYTGTPLKDILQRRFDLPVYIDNDVNVMALTEKYFGVGIDTKHFLCLTLGTGVGGAIISNGSLLRGVVGAAGELGHISVNLNGPRCSCGNYGCLELYASGTGIARMMNEQLQLVNSNQDKGIGVTAIDAKETVSRWLQGDAAAIVVLDQTFKALSSALSGLIHTFNPQAIVIGGGVAEIGEPLFSRLRLETAAKTMPSMYENVRIVPAVMGAKSGMIGAAMQVWEYQ